MKILIVEDEYPTAEDLKYILKDLFGKTDVSISIETTLQAALCHIKEKPIDLLFLDLNLNGRDGFDLLKEAVSASFHTIIVSAYQERAIEAYEYGVLDFIPKPYTVERIQKALDRLNDNSGFINNNLKYLSVRENNKIKVIPLNDIRYFKGANVYVELILNDGSRKICDKTLNNLCKILPAGYARIHKSYILKQSLIKTIVIKGGGKYEAELISGELLPVSRPAYKLLKESFEEEIPS